MSISTESATVTGQKRINVLLLVLIDSMKGQSVYYNSN
jgi:hypothetical protein